MTWINLLHLCIAAIIGGVVGNEREKNDKPAGLRTCILLCLGACVFTIASLIIGEKYPDANVSRLIANVAVGIGFMGSGVIIEKRGNVEGITTAATMWALAGVGIVCGIGELGLALVLGVLILLVLKLKHIEPKYREKND